MRLKTKRWTNQGLARRGLLGKAAFALTLLLLAAVAWTPPPAGAKNGNTPLQFTSQGHALGFGTSSLYIAAGDHMMRIEWAGGRSVSPVAERSAGPGDARATGKVQALERVSYPEVWNGITAVYEKSGGAILKSSYRIQAGTGGRPVEQILLLYNRPVRVDQSGDLVVSFERGEMREQAPVAWQETGGARTLVAVAYRLAGEREVGFEVGGYDRALPLIIDPTLTWNTFLGGSGTDYGRSIAVDGSGNVYVAGYSNASWGSPIRAYTAGYDAYAAKLDSSGVLQWNTFLGGSGLDDGRSIAVDGSGSVYVAGYSATSWGSPIRPYTAGYDAYVAKLNGSGTLQWNTFLGGSGTDYGVPIVVDGGGNVYVAGFSNASWGSPVRPYTAGYDTYAAKLNGSGALQWNTFLGGSGTDYCYGITLDGGGNVYMAGYSNASWGSPVRPYTANYDAYAAKLNSSGALQWHTFLGGNGIDYGRSIVVDGSGTIFMGGISDATWGTPLRPYSAGYDAFAVKLDASGNLIWNLFLGGSGTDYGYFIGLDGSSNVYITGYSTASWGSPVRAYSAGDDAYAAKLDSSGNLIWNLFLGGTGTDRALSLAVDGSRNVYVTGYSTASWGSPVRAYSAGYDAFVAKIPETPTLIELASFRATPRENYIALTWETASEKDNLGFYLWRADGPSEDYRRITPALIPATGDAVTGAQYAYQDFDVILGESYSYKLEDIDTAGVSAFHGPVSAVMGTIELLSPENGAKGWADSPVLFAWNGGPYSQFKLEFSSSADFTAPVLTRPASGTKSPGEEAWTTETQFMPTLIEWKLIRALSARNGVVYWRVRGKTTDGYEGASDANRLTIQLERRLAPDRPLIRK
jgi:hypothetical protein